MLRWLSIFLALVVFPAAAQERGEEPSSIGRENAQRDLRLDDLKDPGFDADDIARQRRSRTLQGLDTRRQQRNAYTEGALDRLQQDRTNRQSIRDARTASPAERRTDRRRDRTDRRLRERINRAMKR